MNWRFGVLDRYVFREALSPTVLGLLVYTFIMLINALFQATKFLVFNDASLGQVGQYLLLSVPNILVLTLPMALLFGCLVAVGRLSADSELTALRASGVSLFSLYRPVLVLSSFATLVTLALMVWLLPRGNVVLTHLAFQMQSQSLTQTIEPRSFVEDFEGWTLYIWDIPPEEKRWHGVFLAEDLPRAENQVITAEWGELQLDEESDRLLLRLENIVTHKLNFREPRKYQTASGDWENIVLKEGVLEERNRKLAVGKGMRSKTLGELRTDLRDPYLPPEIRRLTQVNVHKRLSIPVACLVFGLLALPLGFTTRRGGGRSTGFVVSLAVILLYWMFLENGEQAAYEGRMPPWLSMWLPNLLLTGLGFLLLFRKNEDKSVVMTRIFQKLRDLLKLGGRRLSGGEHASRRRSGSRDGIVLRLPRPKSRFPNLLDRYVIRIFFGVFLFVELSLVTVFLIGDFSSRVDEMGTNNVSSSVVLNFYRYLTLDLAYQAAPIAVLLTTLILFGLLSRSNEVLAAKASGVSLYRLALPAVLCALAVAGLAVFLENSVLPDTNQKAARLKDTIKGKENRRTYRRADRQWLFGQGRYIYNYLRYDDEELSLDRLQIFEFDPEDRVIRRRLFTDRAQFVEGGWVFGDGWLYGFDRTDVQRVEPFEGPVVADYPETPDYFESELKLPQAMNFGELQDYVREVEGRGQRVPKLEVALQRKVAFPFIPLIMGILALPFSFSLGRRGALYGVGVGIAVGMAFYGVFAFSTTLGEAGALPPLVAVWAPSIAFGLYSIYRFLGIET